ncbi:MAG: cobalt ECF transporter T component CbiQ [Methanobrevibacter sp.]|uniref:cobalt ECF transporter T component CbiQ n=1 Tax=Methanobrevibacter sp. TaxID=66852 RepID=UPI0026DF532D|nr:cobalt ECF transporter T component CbiQ [Methanobrevibacter sp.]MDO5848025.1 cobalt ECF transporter T component CbiQ [Methanobrevibacter sp.]
MANITKALDLDALASGDSPIHRLEGRVKLVSCILIIVYCVFSSELIVPIILEIYLLILLYLSKLSFANSFKRILILLPFGGMIIIFQPFLQPGNVLWSYSWLQISDVGLNFAILLFARLIVSLTAIVILSSTSPMEQIVASFRKLKMPKDFAMILTIMVRFLFVFIDELETIKKAQKSRNFNIHSKLTPYKWRLRQVGYSIAMMFLKSYEQGERTYQSMVSRGFSEHSQLFNEKTSLEKNDYIFIVSLIVVLAILTVIIFVFPEKLGYFGENLALN